LTEEFGTNAIVVLNAEWNKPKDREVNLHRHPAFFGTVEDVIADCCGHCPPPVTIEEEEVAEKEGKMYVAGTVTFMKDDCGRQAIGSFHPLSPDEYTDMAYVGNTELLCQAIIDKDLHYVEQWLEQEGNDLNTRDHTGRCPLHLAVSYSSVDVVQCLIDRGARLVARLVDGKTALHLACLRGDPAMVFALLRKSESNEEDEMKKSDEKRRLRMAAKATQDPTTSTQDNTFEMIDKPGSEMDVDALTDGSMVHIENPEADAEERLDGKDDSPDVYDVNVLTWDTPTSPLHLAILSGHQAVVECLVQDFGANVLLPIILPAQYAGGPSSGVLLTLTQAFTLPLSEAKDMTRLLFKLGASSAQADSQRKTALQYCISSQPALLETYLASDPVGVARALKHVSVQGYSFSPTVSGPLLEAISNRDLDTALRLLSAGVKVDVPFEAYLKGVEKSATRVQFETTVEQPIVRAIEGELPLLGSKLIEQHGVDSNTMTKQGWSSVHGAFGRRENGKSLLDGVNDKIKELRDWKHETTKDDPPVPLEEDSSYLSSFSEGTYQHWYAVKQIENAKSRYEREFADHAKRLSKTAHDEVGLEEKQAAVYDKLDQFRRLQSILQANSAKTFKELHPEVEEVKETDYRMNYHYPAYQRAKPEPFKLTFGFNVTIPSDEVRARYIRLFEAVWKGEVKTIKELTLLPWTDIDGERRAPLQIAVQDDQKHSPLSIAILSGNFELAKMVMSIATAQYTPPDPPKAHQYRVTTDCDSDDEGDDSGDDDGTSTDLPIASEAVDDNMTIEDIGEISLSVKSNIRPEQMLCWTIPSSKHAHCEFAVSDLVELALARRDMQLLTFLLDLSEEYTGQLESTDTKAVSVSERNPLYKHINLRNALLYGDPYMLAELIKRTATGLSIDQLALEHGASDTTAASKYYQGLSVHGRKRKDWADAGRNTSGNEESGPQVPPLLQAALSGTLEQVEWLLSDAPLRCYKHFAQAHQDDKRLQKIQATTTGFEGALKAFLNNRSQFAIHCCVTRCKTSDALEKLSYLIKALPDAVEARSADQRTPLLRAFSLHNVEAARILIEAGADQTARDGDGMNLLHQLVATHESTRDDTSRVQSMIDLIDKRLIASMCLQRTSAEPGSLTPLALWLARICGSDEYQLSVTRLLLELGGEAQLETFNGEGLTVLHTVTRMSSDYYKHSGALELAKTLLEHHSDLATWENATGKTSLELVEDSALALKCSNDGGNNGRRRGHYQHGQSKSITDLPPREFINRKRSADDSETDDNLDINPKRSTEKMRKLLAATQAHLDAEGRGRRRLVTLNEASEVARRLAAIQRKKIETEDEDVARREDGQPVVRDQVEQWFRFSGLV
jgi:ankyrin repeat protein